MAFSSQANADAIVKVEKLNRAANMSYKVAGKRYTPRKKVSSFSQVGRASWYGKKFHGRKTSSGERYDMNEMTAAHKTLPIPSYARVTNLQNGKSVVVRINDRGPFHGKRIVDVSKAAAKRLGFMHTGTAKVRIEQIVPEKHADNAVQNEVRSMHVNGSQNTPVKVDTQAYLQKTGGHLKLAKVSGVF
ncbi:septal ring lytic transglycosylase RlpA family protein [Neisseria sp. CSL10203-ORH2]|uniref:Endolytic peptidoglycan transglycosylase RlpA n=1 Tax=Neisseria montereyensis TaxID=2973938 RepID=A0ABT2FCG5_9NEIS|nr:septal ring lytic transglycosylase RlpA family protein [Neisseria montereyensis]MCS4533929.1 septal ring lytic transglycosylase RlpA family protein [Neisseria montereyensis]